MVRYGSIRLDTVRSTHPLFPPHLSRGSMFARYRPQTQYSSAAESHVDVDVKSEL